MSNQPAHADRFHPWKPGQIIKLCGTPPPTKNSTPLFRGPRGRQEAFKQVPWGTEVMYTDSDGEKQSLMIQVIHEDSIGWTYWSCGRSL